MGIDKNVKEVVMDVDDYSIKIFQGDDLDGLYSVNNYQMSPIFAKVEKYNEVYDLELLSNHEINVEIAYMLFTITILKCGTIDLISSMCDNLSVLMQNNSFPKLRTQQEKKEWTNILNRISKQGMLFRSVIKNEKTQLREVTYWATQESYNYVNAIFKAFKPFKYEKGYSQVFNKDIYVARLSAAHLVTKLYKRLADDSKFYEFFPKDGLFILEKNRNKVYLSAECTVKCNGTQLCHYVIMNGLQTSLAYPLNGRDSGFEDVCMAAVNYSMAYSSLSSHLVIIVLVDNLQRLQLAINLMGEEFHRKIVEYKNRGRIFEKGVIYFSSLSYIRKDQDYLLEVDFAQNKMRTVNIKDI